MSLNTLVVFSQIKHRKLSYRKPTHSPNKSIKCQMLGIDMQREMVNRLKKGQYIYPNNPNNH